MPRGRRALAPDVDIRRATGGRAMPETSMRRALIAVALVIVLIVALVLPLGSVPAPSAQPSAPLPIKIGYQAVASWLLFGARSLKLYEKAGLAPTFVKFTAGAPPIAPAPSQSIDAGMGGTGALPPPGPPGGGLGLPRPATH